MQKDWFNAYPVAEVIGDIKLALSEKKRAVLSSPTGSGKSTVLPLALMNEPWLRGRKIIMLEPRRIAAYAVAGQLARNHGCQVGETVGYRMRLDSKVSAQTKIEVVTEGMLTRKLQRDPELSDTALVIFDEFHERSLQSDLALALTLDAAESLRDDLRILAMSATMDCEKVSELLDNAPQIKSSGRSYPVEIRYEPRNTNMSLSENVARIVQQAFRSEDGSMLVFLPGEAEITDCAGILNNTLASPDVNIIPLYGRLDNDLQRRAIEPAPAGRRKIVLATAIAESSLTIDGVRIVVDSGFTKLARFNVNSSVERLETLPVSQAAAIQRSGRAGRTEPGVAYRLWSEHEQDKREFARPGEISYSDLSSMRLELAAWGVNDISGMRFMEKPPTANWEAAGRYLHSIGAIDPNGSITAHGRLIHQCSLSVRAGHLIAVAQKLHMPQTGIRLAALLDGVDTRRSHYNDISVMLNMLGRDKSLSAAEQLVRILQKRLMKVVDHEDRNNISVGALLAAAFPMQVAKRRGALGELKYLMAGGRAALWREMTNIAGNEFIVALNINDRFDNAVLQSAASVEAWEIEEMIPEYFTDEVCLKTDPADLTVEASEVRKLGAIVWHSVRSAAPDRSELCKSLAAIIRKQSLQILNMPESVKKLQGKIRFIRQYMPECSIKTLDDDFILEHLEELLDCALPEKFSKNMLKNVDWHNAVYNMLDYQEQRSIKELLPEKLKLENNREFKIDYTSEPPALEAKLQFFFGVRKQPSLFNGRLPLQIRLLSPAGRPVQTTSDIGNFWGGSYKLVRNDLKGRYPKHDWPENP